MGPKRGEVSYVPALEGMMGASTPQAALGLRIGLWLVALSPIWMLRTFRTFPSLTEADRARTLGRLLEHGTYAVRELTLLLKLGASLALFALPSVRELSHYDRVGDYDEPIDESGERPRVRLPVSIPADGREVA